jgi:DNA-binding NarL/FixJ family response regulator
VIVISLLSHTGTASANSNDWANAQAVFPVMVGSRIDNCALCHTNASALNPFGAAYKAAGRSQDALIAIQNLDSDGDGFTNLQEINFFVQGLLGAGVNGYHLKDQPLSDLKLVIQRILSGERWISSSLIGKLVGSGQSATTSSMLTARQRDILRLLQDGLDNHAIAVAMSLSIKTVENHLTRLYRQLQVQSRLEAVNYLAQHPEILRTTGQEAVQTHPDTPHTKSITILLVDDNPRYLRQLQRVLGKICPSAILYEAESILEAVQVAQRVLPMLVLVDVVLGEEDGIRCARRVKAVSQASRVVLISAYPDREFHRLSLEAGAVAFLDKKDLDAVTLQHVIEDLAV